MNEPDSGQFAASASNWLSRAYYTPVSDALRGRLSARYDVRSEIAAAGLPAPLAQLIWNVVRATRLWRSERVDVARELIAHFSDGLASGRTAEKLTAEFGDPAQAARLIKKAKIRNRPLWWQLWRVASRLFLLALAVGIVGYSALAARFYLGRPAAAHNFWHEMNAARRVPDDQRAWPLYRTAAIKLGKGGFSGEATDWTAEGPSGEHWNDLVALVERQRESLDLVRQGAERKSLGCYYGDPSDRQAAREARPNFTLMSDTDPVADDNPVFVSMILDYVQVLRELHRLLAADTLVAAAAGDAQRAYQDLTASISMAGQIFQPRSTIIEQLVGIAMFSNALQTAGGLLEHYPQLFSETQLRDLAHTIAAYQGGKLSFDMSMEETGFDDVLQRLYTDDGHGDGRITPEGMVLLHELLSNPNGSILDDLVAAGRTDRNATLVLYLVGPGVSTMVGSRRENRELYDSLTAEAGRVHAGPPWQWDRKAVEAPGQRLSEIEHHTIERIRYMPAITLAPYLAGVYDAIERLTQNRDATEVAIALVLWQHRHGQWPADLSELVPDLLPAVPPDRLDGQPLRYAIRDGKPVVYSVGADRDDDGGRAAKGGESGAPTITFGKLAPEKLQALQDADNDGDWILWPPAN